jgi:hypothetical protein
LAFPRPSATEITMGFLDYLRDEIKLDGQYQDRDLQMTSRPGEIGLEYVVACSKCWTR